ncbi:MAG: alpha/beta fold hydrolase [Acidobacteriaceae bacterium]
MMERRQIRVDGLGLSYLERGRAARDQPSLVLLHGLMGCAETFIPLVEHLRSDLHIVALDLPGAGDSERSQDIDPRLAATARCVAGVLEKLDLQRPIVLGHSYGGAVALSLAVLRPDAVRSLVLLSPAHPYYDESDPVIRFYLSKPGELFAHVLPWLPEWLQMIGLRRMAGPQSEDTPERLRPYRNNLRTPGTILHLLRLLRTWDRDMNGLRRLLRRSLQTSTLILWGECDRAVPIHSAPRLCAHLAQAELVALPGVGHRPAEEVPEQVAGSIDCWLEKRDACHAVRYRKNVSASQARTVSAITPSMESGD